MNMREVADIAGVSPATVSRIVNGRYRNHSKIRRRVEEVLDNTGYVRRKRVAPERNLLCVSTYIDTDRFMHSLGGSHGSLMGQAIEREAMARHYSIMTTYSMEHAVVSDKITDYDIAGIIALNIPNPIQAPVPQVILNHYGITVGPRACAVDTDDATGMLMAITHLRKKGHSRIAFFGAGPISIEYCHPRFCFVFLPGWSISPTIRLL